MLKFTKSLSEKRYVLAFDLAKITTGWALFDLKEEKIVDFGMIKNVDNVDNFWYASYCNFSSFLSSLVERFPKEEIVVTKEQCPSQAGPFSSIAALQTLYATHAVVDVLCDQLGLECYDYDGVHVSTVRAFFRKVSGVQSPQKEDVRDAIKAKFPDFDLGDYPLDITDAIGVAVTLVYAKYNADCKQQIKQLKKQLKEAKSKKKQDRLSEEIEKISSLTFECESWE